MATGSYYALRMVDVVDAEESDGKSLSSHEVEEDWSSFMPQSLTGYGLHDIVVICLDDGVEILSIESDERKRSTHLRISSVGSLALSDMMGLANGNFDATGNHVWLGAYLFLNFFGRRDFCSLQSTDLHIDGELTSSQIMISDQIVKLRKLLFRDKIVVELGCGTGVSGLSLLQSQHNCPKSLHLTDGDESSLDLCRENCANNMSCYESSCTDLCTFELLTWRSDYGDTYESTSYDTVIATDVLYDLASLKPLIRTASALLGVSGYFVLSHVPRACLDSDDCGVSTSHLLEECICEEARCSGFGADVTILRPGMIVGAKIASKSDILLQETSESGAAILIFQKDEYT